MELKILEKNKYTILKITGEEDSSPAAMMTSLKKMMEEINRIVENGATRIIFDLSACDYINSSLISLFIQSAAKTNEFCGETRLVSPTKNVRQILELVGVDKIIPIYENVQELEKGVEN